MAQQLQFFLLESTDYDEFCTEVQQRLNDGWMLHGNLFAFPDYVTGNKVDTVRYLQAFLKDISLRERPGFITGR
jgi:hypothetical protein